MLPRVHVFEQPQSSTIVHHTVDRSIGLELKIWLISRFINYMKLQVLLRFKIIVKPFLM